MKTTCLPLFCFAFLAAASNAPAANTVPLTTTVLHELQQINGVPGMAAAIFKDGQLVWHGESGYSDVARGIPVSADTRFRLASVSKFVTTGILARLVDQNRIELTGSVGRYVQDYPLIKSSISLSQLTNHTSGTPHYHPLLDLNYRSREEVYKTAAGSVHLFADRPLADEPGEEFLYSSYGFNLLAAAMEGATQERFPTMVNEFARRAGAQSLEAELPGTKDATVSRLYAVGGQELERGNLTNGWAAGGLLSNATDIARVGAKILDPDFVSAKTLKLFLTPTLLNSGAPVQNGRYTMGVGWRLGVDHRGRTFFHHSGNTAGGRSHVSVYPNEKLVISMLSNASWVTPMDVNAAALIDTIALTSASCRTASYQYSGRYKDTPITGQLRSQREGQHCVYTLSADHALGAWLASGKKARTFSLYAHGDGTDMVLVSPMGLFPVKRVGKKLQASLLGKGFDLLLREM